MTYDIYLLHPQVMLTTQNVLILILCISDLFLIVFNMPLTLIEVLRFYWHTSFFGMVRNISVM